MFIIVSPANPGAWDGPPAWSHFLAYRRSPGAGKTGDVPTEHPKPHRARANGSAAGEHYDSILDLGEQAAPGASKWVRGGSISAQGIPSGRCPRSRAGTCPALPSSPA